MMLLDDLADYLIPFSLLTGIPVQKGFFQEIPDSAVAIRETGGFPPEHVMGAQGGVVDEPTVQIVTRAKDYQSAMQTARDLFTQLDGLRALIINSVTYHFVAAMQPPFFLQRDANHRFECAFNLHIKRSVP